MEPARRNVGRIVSMLNLCGFMDLLGVGMIMPFMSTRLRELGASPTVIGLVGSLYGGVQLISSPLMGKFSDNFGRFPSLLLAVAVTAVGYFIVGAASSILAFAIGRFLLGCLKHNNSMAKAYLYDLLPENQVSAAIGRFHSFASFGFILGPIIGGHIAETDGGVQLAAYCSTLLFVINAGMIWWLIPNDNKVQMPASKESRKHKMDQNLANTPANGGLLSEEYGYSIGRSLLTFKQWFSIWFSIESLRSSPWVEHWHFLLIRFLAGLSVIVYRTNFVLNLTEKHGASRTSIGYLTSYTAAASTIFGFCVGFVTNRYKHNDARLFFHMLLLEIVTLLCLCLAPSVPFILVFLTPFSFTTSMMRVCSTKLLISVGGRDRVAAILGLNQSINSFSRMVAPTLVGVIQEWSMDAACYFSLVATILAAILMTMFSENPQSQRKDRKQKDD